MKVIWKSMMKTFVPERRKEKAESIMSTTSTTKSASPNKAQQRWKKAINTVIKAIHADGFSPVDTVQIKLRDNSRYLQELSQDIQIATHHNIKEKFPILKMTEAELQAHQLSYNNGALELAGIIADTTGKVSKEVKDSQAFVMSKNGKLYTAQHNGSYNKTGGKTLVHGSFLSDKPVEMAGLISIKNGKITMISSDSGHYQPEPLDMYRGVKNLQKEMPGVFRGNCKIIYYDKVFSDKNTMKYVKKTEPLTVFMNSMEAIEHNGKPRHENLRDDRLKIYQDYKNELKFDTILVAIKQGNIDIINELVNNKYDLDNKSQAGATYLQYAVHKGKTEIAKILIENGANLDLQDIQGNTALRYAVSKGNIEIAKILIEKGANLNLRDGKGMTVLQYAVSKGNTEIAKILIENGANLDLQDAQGNTALQYAVPRGNTEIVNLIKEKSKQKAAIIEELSIAIAVELFGDQYFRNKGRVADQNNIHQELLRSNLSPSFIKQFMDMDELDKIGLVAQISKDIRKNGTKRTAMGRLTGGIMLKEDFKSLPRIINVEDVKPGTQLSPPSASLPNVKANTQGRIIAS